jgi:hypothetical protein
MKSMITIVRISLQGFFATGRWMLILPAIILAVPLSLWNQFSAPLAAVLILVVPLIEREYNRPFSLSPTELSAYELFPVDWKTVMVAKNVSAVLATLIMCGLGAVVIVYFAPAMAWTDQVTHTALALGSLIFPLLIFGNLRHPSEMILGSATAVDHLVDIVLQGLFMAVFAVPFLVLGVAMHSSIAVMIYIAVTAFVWWQYSLPRAVAAIQHFLQPEQLP